jgi:hypothetical protein
MSEPLLQESIYTLEPEILDNGSNKNDHHSPSFDDGILEHLWDASMWTEHISKQ